ncbi:MAG: hybrid sensor histidine kinase/response regulator, partial [Actinobacteria bacterium]|nr:hybrid sensor histidine kinase/response regulator [Actinomycetota bacterium]
EYMFLPFFTNREGRPGLGLSTARRVMWRLGGRVGTEEGTGDGGMFFLEFPTRPSAPSHR